MPTDPAPTDQAIAPAAKTTTALDKTPVTMGVAPKSLDEAWRLATVMARSELVPKNFRNKPEDILVAIQHGMELGLAPLQALASIAVINGRATIWGDGFLAIIMASPLYRDHDEFFEVGSTPPQRRDGLTPDDLKNDHTTAVCTFWRAGKAQPVTARFSVGQAKKAGLLGKEGPWQTYPDRMLKQRARGFAGRDAFPDLLRGIRTAEEAIDTDDGANLPAVREVRRMSETPASTAAAPKLDDLVVFDAVGVLDVETFLGGATVILSNGQRVDVTDPLDAAELAKVKGTKHRFRIEARKVIDTLQLESFSIAD